MVRTTIMLPMLLKRRVEMRARQQSKSLGRYVRESLETALRATPEASRRGDSLFGDMEARPDAWPADVAENHDRYLAMLWHEQCGGGHRPKRKSPR